MARFPRYSRERLSDMARIVREAAHNGGDRAFQLFLTVAEMTGLDPNDVRERIYALEVPRETRHEPHG